MRSLSNYCVNESPFILSEDENSSPISSFSRCNEVNTIEISESSLKDCEDDADNLKLINYVDKELMDKIVSQVETYFSDENLIKDEFLLKHIRRNKEGYVSLKLVSSLRKVKALTKDCRVVAYCIENESKKLQLNKNYTKIRRINPLPNADGSKCSRTVIAYHIPDGKDNVEQIGKTFSRFGDIALIRILRPQLTIPTNIPQSIEQFGNVFSTIEFYNKNDAENAVKSMSSDNNWRNSMKVIAMKPNMNTKNTTKSGVSCAPNFRNIQSQYQDCYLVKQNFANGKKLNNFYNKLEYSEKPKAIHLLQRHKSNSYSAGDEVSHQITNRMNRDGSHRPRLPTNIIRSPYGPDGTNGFKLNRQRSNSQP